MLKNNRFRSFVTGGSACAYMVSATEMTGTAEGKAVGYFGYRKSGVFKKNIGIVNFVYELYRLI